MNAFAQLLRCFCVIFFLIVAGCGGGGKTPTVPPEQPPPAPPVGIGAAGGTVVGPNGAKAVIPAGALTTTIDIKVSLSPSDAPALPAGFTTIGQMYAFTPHGTVFSTPVTMTLPFDPAAVPAGSTPVLYKTNALNQWGPVAGATFGADSVSADVSGFSHAQVLVPKLIVNEPERSWEFSISRGDGDFIEVLPKPDGNGTAPVGALLEKVADFGPAAIDATIFLPSGAVRQPDGIANGMVMSTANGVTYGVFAEAPRGALGTSEPVEGATVFRQSQSFIKNSDDAKLKFTLTSLTIELIDFSSGGVQEGLRMQGQALLSVKAYQSPGDDLISNRSGGVFFHAAGRASLGKVGGQFVPNAETNAEAKNYLWGLSGENPEFDSVAEDAEFQSCFGRKFRLSLKKPITYTIDLSSVGLLEEFTVETRAQAISMNRQGRDIPEECVMSAVTTYLRDPLDVGGVTVEFEGLEPTNRPLPPPPDEPVEPAACVPGPAPDPAAGQLQFGDDEFTVEEIQRAAPVVTVTRTGGNQGAVTATLTASDGTAVGGTDYTPVNTTVFFGDGEAGQRLVSLEVLADQLDEEPESLTLTLSNPGGCAALGARSTATVSIVDNTITRLPARTVGGTVSGLAGSGLALRDVNGSVLTPANGPFVFPIPVPHGLRYDVSIQAQPTSPAQICSVDNGSGVIDQADITNVAVTCVTPVASGSLDPVFGAAGKVTAGVPGGAVALALQGDGRLLALGNRVLTRYNVDGTPDTSFGAAGTINVVFAGGTQDEAHGLAVQPDGRIVVVGHTRTATLDDFGIVRYNADGTPDAGFGTAGRTSVDFSGLTDRAFEVLIQPDGAIVVAGHASRPDVFGGDADFAVVRLSSTGVPDAQFGTQGKVTTEIGGRGDFASGAALQPDGKIVVVGRVARDGGATPDFGIVRYNANGTPDADFAAQGILRQPVAGNNADEANDVVVLANGELVVSGFAQQLNPSRFNFAFLRISQTGQVNSTTTTEFSVRDDFSRGVAIQPDGKIVVVGQTSNRQQPDFAIARYDANGSLDSTFDGDGRMTIDFFGAGDDATDVVVQPDGRIVVGGLAVNGATSEVGLVRIVP